MKKIIIILVFLITVLTIWSTDEGRVIPELVKPTGLAVDDTQLYVIEETTIKIFDLKSLKLITTFGKKGSGPQEFDLVFGLIPITIDVQSDKIMVASNGKISNWGKNGGFIDEMRYNPISGIAPQKLKDGRFIALSITAENNVRKRIVVLCNKIMEREKTIYSVDDDFQSEGQGLKVLSKPFVFQVGNDKIYLPGEKDDEIDVFNLNLERLFTITVPDEKRSVSQTFKDQIIEELKTNPQTKSQFEILKPIKIPDQFPAYANFLVTKGILYVITWNFGRDAGPLEYYKFDADSGKALGKGNVKLVFETPLRPYSMTVNNGILYQIIENDNEEWVLTQEPLK